MHRVLALAALMALAGCSKAPSAEELAKAAAERATVNRDALIERGRMTVRGILRDPESARFRKGGAVSTIGMSDGTTIRIACGYVNAKNGFGGYTGDGPWWFFAFADGSGGACLDKLEGCAYTLMTGPEGPTACIGAVG